MSENGLKDLLQENLTRRTFISNYTFEVDDIEVAITHTKTIWRRVLLFCKWAKHNSRRYAFSCTLEKLSKTIRDFYGKNYEAVDIRASIFAAVS